MLDTKTIAAVGVTTTVVVGGIGIAASQGSSEDTKGTETNQTNAGTQETTKRTLKDIKNSPKENSYASKIKASGFELMTEESEKSDWNKVSIFNVGNPGEGVSNPTIEDLQNECVILLEKTYSGTTIPQEYKNAINKCTKRGGLKTKLEGLGLSVLTAEDNSVLNERWNEIKGDSNFKAELKDTYEYNFEAQGKDNFSTENAKELIGKCDKYSNENISYNKYIESRWKRYLLICAKDKGEKTYDSIKNSSFWVNGVAPEQETE